MSSWPLLLQQAPPTSHPKAMRQPHPMGRCSAKKTVFQRHRLWHLLFGKNIKRPPASHYLFALHSSVNSYYWIGFVTLDGLKFYNHLIAPGILWFGKFPEYRYCKILFWAVDPPTSKRTHSVTRVSNSSHITRSLFCGKQVKVLQWVIVQDAQQNDMTAQPTGWWKKKFHKNCLLIVLPLLKASTVQALHVNEYLL